jgi:flagellar hook assembly protein FlgD
MLRAPITAPSPVARPLQTAAVALVAAATVITSLVGVSSATAASGATGPVVRAEPTVYFSPNGDHVKDKARIAFTLAKKADVTVKVRRTNSTKTVFRKELGKVTRGTHTWRWNGKNHNGRIVRDGQYRVVFVADQVAKDGKTRRDSTDLYVDTVYEPAGVQSSTSRVDTVYPLTTVITDRVGFRHGCYGCTEDDSVARFEFSVVKVQSDGSNTVVYTNAGPYPPYTAFPITWDGRDNAGQALPAGRYLAYLDVVDLAGNAGRAGFAFVDVSGVPLVEATGTVTLAPTRNPYTAAGSSAARVADGRPSTTGGDDPPPPVPCGTVVPSTVYPDAGAMSYRSSDACGGTAARPSIATARGGAYLTSVNAPRGISSAQVAMRGKPTVDGETDTAELVVGTNGTGETVTSAAVAGESVTTGSVVAWPWDPTKESYRPWVGWTITTRGVDSYDVADVTVTYKYLTPQQ